MEFVGAGSIVFFTADGPGMIYKDYRVCSGPEFLEWAADNPGERIRSMQVESNFKVKT
jgi:hypothetical protein